MENDDQSSEKNQISDHSLHFDADIGESDTVLIFLHGFMFSDIWERVRMLDQFRSKGFGYVTIDLLGFGSSDKPDIQYTLEEHTVAVEQTIRKLGLEDRRLIGIGYSTGANIMTNMMARKQILFDRAVVISPPYRIREQINRNDLLRIFYLMSEKRGFDDFFNLFRLGAQMFSGYRKLSAETRRYMKEFRKNCSVPSKHTFRNVVIDFDVDDLIDQVDRPILWVHSEHDEYLDLETAQEIADQSDLLQLSLFSDGHYITRQNAPDISQRIIRFIGTDLDSIRSEQCRSERIMPDPLLPQRFLETNPYFDTEHLIDENTDPYVLDI